MVPSVDDESQIQALDQTQPKLPLDLDYVEGHMHARLPAPRHHDAVRGFGHPFGAGNYATVKRWLAERHRYHLRRTPTYSSWLNQAERWFGLLSE